MSPPFDSEKTFASKPPVGRELNVGQLVCTYYGDEGTITNLEGDPADPKDQRIRIRYNNKSTSELSRNTFNATHLVVEEVKDNG